MADSYIGEIRMFAGNFAPAGWAFCDGTQLSISEYEALFNLIGTTYGGDGQGTFALPDLRGRVPVHAGTHSSGRTLTLGEQGGVESVTLTTQQIPSHTHTFVASTDNGSASSPDNAVPGVGTSVTIYRPQANPATAMDAGSVQIVGGSQPHDNMMPFLCISFIIALEGIFPSQN